MRRFTRSIGIAAPADRVWQVMSEIETWPEWTPSVIRIRKLDAGPLSVGTRALIRQPRFPPALFTVVAIEAGHGFTWVSTAPGLRVVADHRVEPEGAGSRATLSLAMQGAFGGLWGMLTKGLTGRYLDQEASGLKARSEDPAFRHQGLRA